MHTLSLSDALALLPTHADRLTHAEQTAALTGAFPWGLADPGDPEQRPEVSAALLIVHRRRHEAGLGPIADLMSEWRRNGGSLTIRDSIGPTVTLAWIGAKEWMVCRWMHAPIVGKSSPTSRQDVDAALLDLGYVLLDGDAVRFSLTPPSPSPSVPAPDPDSTRGDGEDSKADGASPFQQQER